MKVKDLAYTRSGDKGTSANIGVIAKNDEAYRLLKSRLTIEKMAAYFQPLGLEGVERYELDNLACLNFILKGVLAGGASLSLRTDSQGKALANALLELEI